MGLLPFASANEDEGINEPLLREYAFFLAGRAEGTIEAYLRIVRQMMAWIAERPGHSGQFQPHQFTKTTVEMYLAALEREGLSIAHRARVKSALSTFAHWLIEEKGILSKNSTRGIDLRLCRCSRLASFQRTSAIFSGRWSNRRKIGEEPRFLRSAIGPDAGSVMCPGWK